ncbi:hypothetical protein HZB07_04625 [Candidatus Saganbacteria bacterium]|nr:hypothetical protein [Candidatus Saganbacteria bacterium]
MKLSKREQILVLAAVFCGIFYLFFQFLLLPKLGEIDQLKVQIKKVRLDLKSADSKLKILETAEKKPGEVKRPEKMVPLIPSAGGLEVLRVLARTTSKSSLQLVFIKPLPGELTDGLKFELACQGRYRQLYDFLSILHNVDLVILIDSLSVVGKNGLSEPLEIRMVITAHV